MTTTTFGEYYRTGTVALTANNAAVVGTGVVWADIEQGDILEAQGRQATVDSVSGAGLDHITLMLPWAGTTATGVSYVLRKDAKSRFDPALTQAKLREFLALIGSSSPTYAVPDDGTPDDSVGVDGTLAVRFNPKPVVFWLKVSGAYVFQGNFLSIAQRFEWSDTAEYNVGDIVTALGTSYSARVGNVGVFPPSDSATWAVFVSGGGRVEVDLNAPGRPAPSEVLIERVFTTDAVFPATLPESILRGRVAATANTIFSIKRNGVQVATATVAAGNTGATFSAASNLSFAADDVFSLVAPAIADATLADLIATFVAYR